MRTRAALPVLAVVALAACSSSRSGQAEESRGADYYYGLAVNYYYEQNAQAALGELQSCFAQAPDHVQAHNLAGLIHLGRKEFNDSLSHFQAALRADESFHMARANLGALYMEMESWEQAIETLTPLLSEPRYGTPYLTENNIGWAKYRLGRKMEAEQHLKRALMHQPELCIAYNNLGIIFAEDQRWEDALDAFNEAVTRCDAYVEAHFHLGVLLEKKGQYAQASARFEKCRKLGGKSLFGRRCERKLQVLR